MEDKKMWWASKAIWLNVIALVAAVVQARFGFIIDAEAQAYILAGINIVLRFFTTKPVQVKRKK